MRVARPGQAGISGWTVGGTGDGHDTHGHSVQTFGKDRVPALFYPRIEADPATRAPGNGPANRSAPPARGFDRRAGGRHRRPSRLRQDDAPLLQNGECLDQILALVEHLPEGSQLAIAGRRESPLPLGRLRAEGRVVEIGADDLAMDQQEAASLLRGAEVDVPEAQCVELRRRTEGWPVALYLAALSLRMGDAEGDGIALGGDDRFFVDYLQSVLLSRLPPEVVAFLTRTSVLE